MNKSMDLLSDKTKKSYESYINLINTTINEYLEIQNEDYQIVADAMKYSAASGKRIRAILTLEFCRMCGGNISDALPFACALELIHAYSLVHDDLPCMDNADMRRGKESCHKKYGYDYALLAGDALLTYAFQLASNAGVSPEITVRCIRSLSNYAGIYGMIGGQTMDVRNENDPNLTLEDLAHTHKLKTGALLRCACEMGCDSAKASKEKFTAASNFGENFGLAFQVVDDILDVTGNPELMGKSVGIDEENNKVTYVTLLGIDGAKKLAEKYTNAALEALDVFDDADILREATKLLLHRNK